MTVENRTFSTAKDAGFALLEACKAHSRKDPVLIGSYRGFALELSWDMWEKQHMLHIIGAERQKISLGTDARGNITRLDNALADLPRELQSRRRALEETRQQLTVALAEKDRPFPQEAELSEKSARLGEIKAVLQLDSREPELLDGEAPDEGDVVAAVRVKKKDARER